MISGTSLANMTVLVWPRTRAKTISSSCVTDNDDSCYTARVASSGRAQGNQQTGQKAGHGRSNACLRPSSNELLRVKFVHMRCCAKRRIGAHGSCCARAAADSQPCDSGYAFVRSVDVQ